MIRIILHKVPKRSLQVSIWFDAKTNDYHPLIELVDLAGNPIRGKLLRSGGKLQKVMAFVEDWVIDNCPVVTGYKLDETGNGPYVVSAIQ